ncbi:MAG: AraC family transcriptional regulator [Prevotella sp.]|nr:AraC family transcriptional regulator [Prevotella sp.]
MKHQENITIQSLAQNEDVQIGYSDNDIIVVDSIQKFAEFKAAQVAMNAVVICTNGKVQAQTNGRLVQLQKNQVAVFPQNLTVTDLMVSPDFDMKAMFLTNRILQSFLREKMSVWNDMMYIRRLNVITMEDSDLLFYTHFYDMLILSIERGHDNPFHTEVVQSLLRTAILALCGAMKALASATPPHPSQQKPQPPAIIGTGLTTGSTPSVTLHHFQHFLNLLNTSEVKRRSVEAYADELCISPKYLSAICKKHSGKTANEWIREHVLEDIRFHLKQTDLTVKQISMHLGFPNTSFFGKYVKEHFGMTPLQVRNEK